MIELVAALARRVRREDRLGRERRLGRHQDEVAAARAVDAAARPDERDVLEHVAHRRELGARERQRRVVDDVRDVDAVRAQHPLDLLEELAGREVPGHGRPRERVADDEVVPVGRLGREADARIADDDLEVVARLEAELLAGGLEHDRVELEDARERAGTRGRDVARHREAAAADVERVDRLAGRGEAVDDVPEQARVGELEPGRVGQVDVRVAERVHPQLHALLVAVVDVDVDAEVGALALAALGCGRRPREREAARDDREQRDPRTPRHGRASR